MATKVTSNQSSEEHLSSIQFMNSSDDVQKNDLYSSSWDGNIRLYNSSDGVLVQTLKISDSPILSFTCLNPVGSSVNIPSDSSKFIVASLDTHVYSGDLNSASNVNSLGTHGAPVRIVKYDNELGILVSGSWDESVKLWDLKSPNEINQIKTDGKVFSCCIAHKSKKLVVCTSNSQIEIYDLRNVSEPEMIKKNVLKHQMRDVQAFIDGTGFVVSSIKGRVAWEYFNPINDGTDTSKKNYVFKCHRETGLDGVELIYPVNSLAFHPQLDCFSTGGGDGTVSIWDGYNRKRLWKYVDPTKECVSSLSFHPQKPVLAVGFSNCLKDPINNKSGSRIEIHTIKNRNIAVKPSTDSTKNPTESSQNPIEMLKS